MPIALCVFPLSVLWILQSPVNADTGSAHDETSSSGNKEDEDDDDDESDDKIDTQSHDPERLKAFNVSCWNYFSYFRSKK